MEGTNMSSSLTVDVELGATIPTLEYGNIRPLIRISGVDPNGDVESQIEIAIAGATKVFASIDDNIINFVEEAAKAVGGGLEINNRLKAVEEALAIIKRDSLFKSKF